MSQRNVRMDRFRERVAEIDDLHSTISVLHWDQQTQMPRGGAVARADHMSTLRRIAHEKLTSAEIGELLETLGEHEASLPYDSDDASMIRVVRRLHERAVDIPADLVFHMSKAAGRASPAWLEARAARDFLLFAPYLQDIVDLRLEQAAVLGHEDNPMEAFVSVKESDLGLADLERMFDDLREVLPPLVAQVAEADDPEKRASLIRGDFDARKQLELGMAAARAIGLDLDERGRYDLSVHPFSITFSPDDVRITTRIRPDDLGSCLFACIHEAGHGLYMQGAPGCLRQTLMDASTSRPELGRAVSFGVHESQSRLWENIVGRSLDFWEYFLPIARAFFPTQFADATPEDLYRAVNVAQPSLIRVEADELTYSLHLMLRFELESDVLNGRLKVKDLAEAWNAKMQQYLGITPPHDTVGVLQDMHWTRDFGGGFQGYALGNVFSAALVAKATKDEAGLRDGWNDGDFSGLRDWMQREVYNHGAKFQPVELMNRATGKGLDTGPYIDYLRTKFEALYDL